MGERAKTHTVQRSLLVYQNANGTNKKQPFETAKVFPTLGMGLNRVLRKTRNGAQFFRQRRTSRVTEPMATEVPGGESGLSPCCPGRASTQYP